MNGNKRNLRRFWYGFSTEECLSNRDFLVDFAYLNLGLIPRSHYNLNEENSLQACLSTMSEDERRKASRKFRKVVRKQKWKDASKIDFHKKQRAVYHFVLRNFIYPVEDNDEW